MPFELVRPGTQIDFIGKRQLCALISAGLILASLIAIPVRGVRFGIDFVGGNEVQVRYTEAGIADEGTIRDALAAIPDIEDPSVVRFGDTTQNEFLIKFKGGDPSEDAQADASGNTAAGDKVAKLEAALAQLGEVTIQRVEFVGPKVGEELTRDGLLSLGLASLFVLAYVAFRFSSRFAPGAVAALVHDLAITAGIFVILGMEFDLRILAAMLAILGYSLNDTIIIYDRIRENMESRTKVNLPDVLNQSVNQTLSRTLLTSGTTFITVLSLYFLGGEVIRPFAFAMLIGVIVGTYSSIYIASPLLLVLEDQSGGSTRPA